MHENLSLTELRQNWSEAWCKEPHARIGRVMLEKSVAFKTHNRMTPEQEVRLKQLIKQYKRSPAFLDGSGALKPGTRLIRNWKGKRHSVLVKADSFEYQDRSYTSLSKIANDITSTRWNGRAFFGLNKKEAS